MSGSVARPGFEPENSIKNRKNRSNSTCKCSWLKNADHDGFDQELNPELPAPFARIICLDQRNCDIKL